MNGRTAKEWGLVHDAVPADKMDFHKAVQWRDRGKAIPRAKKGA
jgi:hypothetical protein